MYICYNSGYEALAQIQVTNLTKCPQFAIAFSFNIQVGSSNFVFEFQYIVLVKSKMPSPLLL